MLNLIFCSILFLFINITTATEKALKNDTFTINGIPLTINKKFELNISLLNTFNPDCFAASYPQMVVNNQYPGPALYITKNDVVQITIRNKFDNANNQSTSVHFHGIRQSGTPFSDGVGNITQLAIKPGEEFVQTFQVLNQSGTYYYHAHVGVQDNTVQGPIYIYDTPAAYEAATYNLIRNKSYISSHQVAAPMITEANYTYHGERVLQWSEYWHQSLFDRQRYYTGPTFRADSGPDSVLLNGRTVYSSNITSPGCKGFSTIDVEPNKIYRLRIIGSLTFRILGILIKDHNMTLIEIDGGYVKPYPLDFVEIGPGQRMSVLIKTGNYSAGTLFPIASNFRYRFDALGGYTANGYGYLRYVDARTKVENLPVIMNKPLISSFPPNIFPLAEAPGWVLKNVQPLVPKIKDKFILRAIPDRTIKITMAEVIEADHTTKFRNYGRPNYAWGTHNASLMDQILSGSLGPATPLDPTDGFSVSHQTYPIGYGEIVDLVFQNVALPSVGICVGHPWHTHGHSHYLIAEGPGDYIHELDKDVRTFATPLYKDVSMVYPVRVNGTSNCGWTKVRILTVSVYF
jgi:L-ascorbate oxidase